MKWTAEAQSRLEVLVQKGATARQAARHLGVPRNAVLGRAWRTGLRFKPTNVPKPSQPQVTPEAAAKRGDAIRRHSQNNQDGGWIGCGRPKGAYMVKRSIIISALAANLVGVSANKAARAYGVSAPSIRKTWMSDPQLVAEAQAVADRVKAEMVAVTEARVAAVKQAAADRKALRNEINRPILASMTTKHRVICERLLDGETLEAVAADWGLTRERIRQIVTTWVARGLDVEGRFKGSAPAQYAGQREQALDRRLNWASQRASASASH